MFAIFVSILLATLAVVAMVVRSKTEVPELQDDGYLSNSESVRNARLTRRVAGVLGAAMGTFAILVMVFSTTYSQDVGEAKVLKSFTGEIVGSDTNAGLGIKAPWVSTVDYDIRNQVVSYVGDGTDQTGPAIPAQDKDGATATIDIVVRYSINPASVEDIYREYQTQDNFVTRLVQNDVRSVVRNIPLKYSTSQFRLQREQAAIEMQKALSDRWTEVGILVDSVDLRDIRYPENIEKSLQAVQEANNNANKAKADLETAKVDAEKTRVEAQAQADYDQIVRCGAKTTTVKEVINGTDTNVVKVIPLQGEECQNRLNEQVLTNKYIDALKELGANGNVIVVPQGSTPLVQTPTSR